MPPTRPALALFPAFAGAGAGAAQEAAPETTPEVGVAVEAPARTPEELAARYAAALRAHFLPGQAPDDPGATVEDDAILAAPPGLEGTWLRGLNLVAPDPTALDPDRLAQACGVQGAELAATTPRSFELRIPYPAEGGGSASFAERHDFLGGNTFLRSFDEAGFLARVLGPMAYEVAPPGDDDPASAALWRSGRGEAMPFHPSPELLAVLQPRRLPELWLRCG